MQINCEQLKQIYLNLAIAKDKLDDASEDIEDSDDIDEIIKRIDTIMKNIRTEIEPTQKKRGYRKR